MSIARTLLAGPRRATLCAAAVLLGSAALYACDDLLVSPKAHPQPQSASLALQMHLAQGSQGGGASAALGKANRLRVRVTRGQATVIDSTVALAPAGQDTRVTLEVAPRADDDSVGVSLSLSKDAAELFRGDARVGLRTGQVVPVAVTLDAVAAGISVPDSIGPLTSFGDTAQLTGALLFATGDTLPDAAFAWTSLDPTIAAVAGGTRAVAAGNGQARLVAASGAFRDTTLVRVRQAVRALRTTVPTDTLLVGDTVAYAAVPVDARGNAVADVPVTWVSTNLGVLEVSPAGVVVARASGTASVLAMAGGATADLRVTVQAGAASLIGPAGGTVSANGDSVRLVIPAGALASPTRITIAPTTAYPASDRVLPGSVYRFGPDGTAFQQPATLTFRYDPARLPPGYPAGELRVHRAAGTGWQEMAGSVDTAARTVTGLISGFSSYGVLARVPVTTVAVVPDTGSLIAGRTLQLSATAKDAGGNPLVGRPVAWTSSDTALATVSASGLVTARRDGPVTITATSGSASGAAHLTILPVPAARVAVAPDTATIFVAGTVQLAATVYDSAGAPLAGRTVTWATSDAAIATVSATGLVTGTGPGTAVVTAQHGGATGMARVTVKALPALSRLAVSPDSAVLTAVGDSAAFTATAFDQYGAPIAGPPVTWSTPDGSIVALDGGGASAGALVRGTVPTGAGVVSTASTVRVRALADGTARVIATAGGVADTATVRVTIAAASVEAAPDSAQIHDPGEPVTGTAIVYDRNHVPVPGARIAWSSAAPSVAAVDSAGAIRGMADGVAVVRAASAANPAAADSITVRVQMVARVAVDDSITSAVGDTGHIAPAALDAKGDTIRGRVFTFTSSDPSVLAIDAATGVGQAVGVGTAVVTSAQGTAGIHGTTVFHVYAPGVARVQVMPDSVGFAVGQTLHLSAAAYDAGGRSLPGETLTWRTADTTVATVDPATGDATGHRAATTTAYARAANGVEGTATLTVYAAAPARVARIVAQPDSIVMSALWQYATPTFTAYDSAGGVVPGATVRWSSPDTLVAVDSATGMIVNRAVGTARVIVQSTTPAPPPSTGFAADTIVVRIYQEPYSVSILPAAPVVLHDPGEPAHVAGVVYDANHFAIPGLHVTWGVNDGSVASVDTAGSIRALGDGSTFVRATYGALNPTTVNVQVQLVASVRLDVTSATLAAGDSVRLTATAYDGSGGAIAGRRFSFTSSNPSVAAVDSAGMVRALSPGTARITAAQGTQGIAGSATIQVPAPAVPFALDQVSANYYHTCALKPDRTPWCWGDNPNGMLGTGGTAASHYPAAVQGGLQLTSISAGSVHTCGVAYDASGATADAWCWGGNGSGQLGQGAPGADVPSPVKVAGGLAWGSVVAGINITCGVTRAHEGYCWGVNPGGQSGIAQGTSQSAPVTAVSGGHAWTQIVPGNSFACGIDTAQQAWCWGDNNNSVLGDTLPAYTEIPQAVPGGHAFVQMAAGPTHACAVDTAGAVWCWGQNTYGQLGAGDAAVHHGLVQVASAMAFRRVVAGAYHTCAITTGDALYCWGRNLTGELGTGNTTEADAPVAVLGGTGVTGVAGGWYFECFAAAGKGYCTGVNQFGQLGDGTTTLDTRTTPAPVLEQPTTPVTSRGTARAPVISF